MSSEVKIENRKEMEFEFEDFNVIYDPIEEIWLLNIYNENNDEEFFLIEGKDVKYEDQKDLLEEKGLQEKDFKKLKNFLFKEKEQ